jgi:hypothetical protein
MRELEQFVSAQRRVFVDEVENENPVMYSEMLMARKLNQLFPMNHGGVIGGIDKTHLIWSRTLRDLVWLGWLSAAKRRDGRYGDAMCDTMASSILEAFAIGRKYAEERP